MKDWFLLTQEEQYKFMIWFAIGLSAVALSAFFCGLAGIFLTIMAFIAGSKMRGIV